MKHINQDIWDKKWDKGLTIQLFIKFLKQYKCLHNFYGYMSDYERSAKYVPYHYFFYYPSHFGIGRLFIMYGINKKESSKNGLASKKDLLLSQLWKFYLLERLDKYPEEYRKDIEKHLRQQLKDNGIRGSEELKQLFQKHHIIIKYF